MEAVKCNPIYKGLLSYLLNSTVIIIINYNNNNIFGLNTDIYNIGINQWCNKNN